MRPADNVKKFFEEAAIDTNPRMDDAVLGKVLTAQEQAIKTESAEYTPEIWRTIMKSKITKVAAAAAIVIAVISGLRFVGGPGIVPSAYAELMQAIENSATGEWIHLSTIEYEGHKDNGEWTWLESETETWDREKWYSFRPFRTYYVRATGETTTEIGLINHADRRAHSYNPKTNTLTIGYENAPDPAEGGGAEEFLKVVLAANTNSDVIKKAETIEGKDVTVLYDGADHDQCRWVVDPEANRIVQFQKVAYDDEKGRMTLTIWEYPDSGPADIYALGVSRDANVVDLSPPRAILDLVNNATAAEASFPQTFFAIECRLLESFDGPVPRERHPDGYMPFQAGTRLYDANVQDTPAVVITVTYRKNYNARRDVYPLWISEYTDPGDYREQLAQLLETIQFDSAESLEAWTQNRLPSQVIILEQPALQHVFQCEAGGTLKSQCVHYDPRDRAALLNVNFWRPPNNRYDLDHHCEGLEPQSGPWGELMGAAMGDEKFQCYFNPARDYICERVYCAPTAAYCQKEWASYAKNVLEYAKTSSGRWYPKRTHMSWEKESYLCVCFVDDRREIDDQLFDKDAVSAAGLAPFGARQ
ncbi:MAG TPA: hypothetical protein VMW16_15030 [Sedimentisphaerales bacterium]|nr:hypothetical protein [Sedimentisphaerales bacterium]